MPLDFSGIYRLTTNAKVESPAAVIAMAPRTGTRDHVVAGESTVEFLVANEVNFVHVLAGEVKNREDGGFDVEAVDNQTAEGKSVIWSFEPLTAKIFIEMGDNGEITGWTDGSAEEFKDDESVLNLYRYQWLLPMLEWWTTDGTSSTDKSKKKFKTKE